MLERTKNLLGGIVLCSTLSACIHTPRGIAASTLPLEQGKYTVIGETGDSDCAWAIFGIIPITTGNETQDAIKEAIASAGNGADGLIQVTVDSYYQHWIVVSRDCTQVEGIAIKSNK
jgi:hypothetical protein